MFAPAFGIAEDPATGSGAGLLATHLARHGEIAFGEEIEIHQGLRIDRPSLLRARRRQRRANRARRGRRLRGDRRRGEFRL
jgi:PhzF family phenazine biosynthesis protein